MALDLHKKPFDEGTIVKLSLYKNYIKEWLPVFLGKSPKYGIVNIFDFFCGPGKDVKGQYGSPLITLELIGKYAQNILKHKLQVSLFFNDKRNEKIENLKDNINEVYPDRPPCKIKYSSEDFENLFQRYEPLMCERNSANFLFLDQNGIKHITKQIFKTIVEIQTTDFLFFISSSTLNRFNDNPEIKKYISIPSTDISSFKYYHIHRLVLEYYRSLIPEDKEYYLSPFSIKKGANIYGLIFGTGHLRGIDKFVTQCWKIDPLTGDSNYDIDQDNINVSQPSLFPQFDKPKKMEGFEIDLENAILNRELKTNKEIYKYALFNGFKAIHARSVVSKLIKDGKLPRQKINISYGSCTSGASTQIYCG